MQLEGLFDVPAAKKSEVRFKCNVPLEERDWKIGLIVGSSGSGKSTLARELFGAHLVDGYEWPADRSLIDAFPAAMGVKEITQLLNSVGFSSPPSWLRPFGVLSNGEQFRATMARAIAESPELLVVDEFTSVVDRTVAQIGSSAIAKTVRRREGQRFVAVTCHYDVIDWLDPDWTYEPGSDSFHWRSERLGRPPIELEVARVGSQAWRLFRTHHYLSGHLNRTSTCFCAFLNGRPVAFSAWLPFVGKLKDSRGAKRNHRTVCLPDFQGVGIGAALVDFCASLWCGLGFRALTTTGHPGEIASKARSSKWTMTRKPGQTALDTKHTDRNESQLRATRASNRLTASFEYTGPALRRSIAERVLARVSG